MYIDMWAVMVAGLGIIGCSKDAANPCDDGYTRGADGACYASGDASERPDVSQMDTGSTGDGVTEEEEGWLIAPTQCEAPSSPTADPISELRYAEVEGFAHVLDAAYDAETDRFYAAGIPALTGWKVDVWGMEETIRYDAGSTEHVTILGSNRVAVSRRGDAGRPGKVEILAVDEFQELAMIPVDDAAGMRKVEDRLYVLSGTGSLYTYDISDIAFPIQLHHMSGMANPWDLEVVGDYAYVADNTMGLVTIDMSNPIEPSIVGSSDGVGGLQDVVVADGYAYGAAGSRGVEIFSLSNPAEPVSVDVVDPGGGSISVSVGGGVLWVANQVGVAAIDVRDPTNPQPMGSKSTGSWAMAVASYANGAFLAGWSEVAFYLAEPAIVAPDARPDLSALYFPERTTEQLLHLRNDGSDTLEIVGLSTAVPDMIIRTDTLRVEPGESAKVRVQWSGTGDLEGSLCIATNDPDEPLLYLQILTSNDDSSVLSGEPAPDFVLPGLDGQMYTLSEQLGQPVLLIYFAAW